MKENVKNTLRTATRDPFLWFIVFVLLCCLVGAMIWWGAPMKESNKNDVKQTIELLERTDTTNQKAVNLRFSPVEEIGDQNVQTVKWQGVDGTDTVDHFTIVKVRKGFMKYKLDGIHQMVK